MKKITSVMLAVLITAAVIVSCADDSGVQTSVSDVPSYQTEENAETEITRKNAVDNLPDMNYEGASFNVLTTSGMEYEIWSDELNGEVTNDAIYNRNSNVMNRFNVVIGYKTEVNSDKVLKSFQNSITAGDDSYQLLANYAYTSYIAISNGLCANWTSLEYVDFTKPWWNKLSNDEATINGILYAAVGDYSVSALLYTYAMFMNITLAEDWNITTDDMYGYVDNGTWTIDKLMTVTKDIYSDANGDGARGMEDIYGYSGYQDESADMFQIAFDNPITKKDSDGMPYPALMTEKITSALEKVSALTIEQTGSFRWNQWRGEATLFNNGTVVFVPAFFKEAFDKFRFMESDYTLLPYPKWDEAQQNYYTGAMDEYSVLMIPSNSPDLEMTGIISEALAVESYKTVTPAFYDIALNGKYAYDAKTSEMIELIMAGRRFDLAFMFGTSDQLQWLPYLFRRQIEAGTTSLASAYAEIEPIVIEGYKTICEYYKFDS